MTSPDNRRNRRTTIVNQQNNILPPPPLFAFAHPLNPSSTNDPFTIVGSSYNVEPPSLTPSTMVANIRAQIANGPQLALSRAGTSRVNAANVMPSVPALPLFIEQEGVAPSLTPSTMVANIRAQIANGPQLAPSRVSRAGTSRA
jgi:hypothetical protein